MLFQSSFATLAAAIALASFTAATPVSLAVANPNCESLGKGPIGFNASQSIYNYQPVVGTYLTIDEADESRIVASSPIASKNQTMFEFFNCTGTPETTIQNEGETVTFNGYITGPDGRCVTVEKYASRGPSLVRMEDCVYSNNAALGNVKPGQHFQIQNNAFYEFFDLNYLGNTPAAANASHDPSATAGAGGYNHFSMGTTSSAKSSNQYLIATFEPKNPQKGYNFGEKLIAQLGNEYRPTE